ncbi:DUF2793 domain-containing protein [Aurantimonas sp. HBX-1]|uniref:DUF2793 domain-containing protein n=1 Tax=Aurantimonas sp. HBX-1 TaxID=2906072 RepID=UPI001F41DE87|nr:DUF2793 domain-containing protein [Aurantimonas sp. HBX-1]UIJ71073.1 DUF2793 domain-containing protein [Aurantimonas sp. HBX-1]
MDETARLKLPLIMAAQAQKHVTHNEALAIADALVHLAVASRGAAEPPSAPAEGVRYLVAAGASGVWAGHDGQIASLDGGAWRFHAPAEGWRCWVADEALLLVHADGAWRPLNAGGNGEALSAVRLGVNTDADTINRLAVKSDAVLLSHDDVTPGSGDLRVTLNKAGAAGDAGLVFQTGYTSRALVGLLGDDDLTVKVSPDGVSYAPVLHALSSGAKVAIRGNVDPAKSAPVQVDGAVHVAADHLALVASSTNSVYLNLGNTAPGAHGGFTFFASGGGPAPSGSFGIYDQTYASRLFVSPEGNLLPGVDNAFSLGSAGARWSAVWAANGTIQTSDARDKTDCQQLSPGLATALLEEIDAMLFRWCEGGTQTLALPESDASAPRPAMTQPEPGKRRHAGFLAQEVRAALARSGEDFGVWGLANVADPESRQWIRPDQLIPVLWAALKETRRVVAGQGEALAALRASFASGGRLEGE